MKAMLAGLCLGVLALPAFADTSVEANPTPGSVERKAEPGAGDQLVQIKPPVQEQRPASGKPAGYPESFDCGAAAGIEPAATALDVRTGGRGDVYYWAHHFAVRRDMANAMGHALRRLAWEMKDGMLKSRMEDVARQIFYAPQDGYGDVYYWVQRVVDQDRAFSWVAQNMRSLKHQACSGR